MKKKFSFDNFLSKGLGSDDAEKLSEELSALVGNRLHEAISKELNSIIIELNQQGHQLKYYYEPSPGDISYRDQENTGKCKLRLGVDTIVSVGFGDTVDD